MVAVPNCGGSKRWRFQTVAVPWWRFQRWHYKPAGAQRLKSLGFKLKSSSIGDHLHEVKSVSTKRSPNNERTEGYRYSTLAVVE
jgi:hypothetical protein